MTRSFSDWLETHGCSTYELWLILNCLITCLGWDHKLTKEAGKAWRASKQEDSPKPNEQQ